MIVIIHLFLISVVTAWPNFVFVILGQNSKYDTEWSHSLVESIIWQGIGLFEKHNKDLDFFETVKTPLFYHFNGSEAPCHWQILTLSQKLIEDKAQADKQWFIFLDGYSNINISNLYNFLEKQDPTVPVYFGHGLFDSKMTIIHHYYGFLHGDEPRFYYPDASAGIIMSRVLLQKIYNAIIKDKKPIPQFTIDASHELARFIFENFQIRLTPMDDVFCLLRTANSNNQESCAIDYIEPRYECKAMKKTLPNDLKVYIKTWSGNHKTRLPVIMNTWGKQFESIEYISDKEGRDPPTKSLGVKNTERGHCQKTFAILEKFQTEDSSTYKWLLIADDDTLINVDALLEPLNCYDSNEKLIIGERYGFGASLSGKGSYNYPTGGAGMIFTRSAVEGLIKGCSCPNVDSPDDMIIGMCSVHESINIIHSPAFHQAQPSDYPEAYNKKVWPISFHKFTDVDPYELYEKHVKVERLPRPEQYSEPSIRNRWFNWEKFKSKVPSNRGSKPEILPEIYFEDSFKNVPSHTEF